MNLINKKFLLTCLLSFLSIGVVCSQNNYYQTQMVGRWYKKTELEKSGIKITSIYVQEFFPNGTISDQAQNLITMGSTQVSCLINTAWNWSVTGDTLYQTRVSSLVVPDFIKENGRKINDPQRLSDTCNVIRQTAEEDNLTTTAFKIIQIN